MIEEMELIGEAYKAKSGQWAFIIKDSAGEEYCRGNGFETEEEAANELEALLNEMGA